MVSTSDEEGTNPLVERTNAADQMPETLPDDDGTKPTIKGVGFFQFVEDQWKDPIVALEPRLSKLSARDFLIVLPEAFNLQEDLRNSQSVEIGSRGSGWS